MSEKVLDPELDQAIKEYHAAEKKSTERLFSLFDKNRKEGTPMAQDIENPNGSSTDLWFKGLAKWGKAWSEREYELREGK